MWARIQQEPVMFQSIIQAVLALGVAFGTALSVEKIGAILALSAAVLSFMTRSQVTPTINLTPQSTTPLMQVAGGMGKA
jgi:hypothetical protein